MTLVKHELRQGKISFMIWTASIGLLLVICIFLFPEMKDQMEDVSDVFSSMGSFTAAFGMDRLNCVLCVLLCGRNSEQRREGQDGGISADSSGQPRPNCHGEAGSSFCADYCYESDNLCAFHRFHCGYW